MGPGLISAPSVKDEVTLSKIVDKYPAYGPFHMPFYCLQCFSHSDVVSHKNPSVMNGVHDISLLL